VIQSRYAGAQRRYRFARRLDDEQRLVVQFDLALPPVDGAHERHDVHARDELAPDDGLGDRARLVGRRGDEADDVLNHAATVEHWRVVARDAIITTIGLDLHICRHVVRT
jgi:hypothetical protein